MSLFRLSLDCLTVTVKVPYLKRLKPDGPYYYYRRLKPEVKAHLRLSGEFLRKSLGTKDRDEAIKRWREFHADVEAKWSALQATNASKDAAKARDTDLAAATVLEAIGITPGDTIHTDGAVESVEDYLIGKYGAEAYYSAVNGDPESYLGETAEDAQRRLRKLLSPADFEARKRFIQGNQSPASPYLSEALDLYLTQHPKGSQDRFSKGVRRAIAYVVEVAGCESAWNKDPVFGVIGIQSGPRG